MEKLKQNNEKKIKTKQGCSFCKVQRHALLYTCNYGILYAYVDKSISNLLSGANIQDYKKNKKILTSALVSSGQNKKYSQVLKNSMRENKRRGPKHYMWNHSKCSTSPEINQSIFGLITAKTATIEPFVIL